MKKLCFALIIMIGLSGCNDEKPATPINIAPTPSPALASTPTPISTPTPTPSATPEPTPVPTQEPTSIPTPILSTDSYSNDIKHWYYVKNNENKPPSAQHEIDLEKYSAYYLGDTEEKTVYLTFDEGYENGFTPSILDTLKEKDVKAAFFMTKSFIRQNPELAQRIADEGHVAANHSVNHPSFPDITDEEIEYELTETSRYFKDVTGTEMKMFFRPPQGDYSERTLAVTQMLGYKTIFWSFAHVDWYVDNQPTVLETINTVKNNHHNGNIMLLHAVSSANTEALADIIDFLQGEGYEFKSLEELK